MNFLRGILGNKPAQPKPVFVEGPGTYQLAVVGESYYHEALVKLSKRIKGENYRRYTTAVLICEDDNPQDANAVRVEIGGLQVGYLDRDSAAQYRQQPDVQPAIECKAVIVGGSKDKANFGVWLDLPALGKTSKRRRGTK